MFPPAAVNYPPELRFSGPDPKQLPFDPGPEPPADPHVSGNRPEIPPRPILKFKRKHISHDRSMALTSDPDRFNGSASLASVPALKSRSVAGDDREEATTEGIRR